MIKIGNNISEFSSYSCQPKTKDELKKIIEDRISKEGPNCDLNDIDVSLITDMYCMFYGSDFNGDISKWNTSNVEDMSHMFNSSDFTGDISNWDVSNVDDMSYLFRDSKCNGDISKWNVANVKCMIAMFAYSKFNRDISKWKINKNCNTWFMFAGCPIKEEYKPKLPK